MWDRDFLFLKYRREPWALDWLSHGLHDIWHHPWPLAHAFFRYISPVITLILPLEAICVWKSPFSSGSSVTGHYISRLRLTLAIFCPKQQLQCFLPDDDISAVTDIILYQCGGLVRVSGPGRAGECWGG